MGLDSLLPGSEPPTDVVSRKVFINGTELGGEVLLKQVTVNKTFNKIATAKLVFIDGSVSERDFPLSNEDQFKPGSEIEIQLGYHGDVETVFEGIIIKHGIKVHQSGSSVLMIEAKDKAIKLTGARKSAYHINKTDSDIISSLAGESTPDVEATTLTHKQLLQFEAADWDFILTRAEANSMLVFTDDGKLNVKVPSITAAVLTATYGASGYYGILEFEAEMDARRQVQSITGHSWDYTQQAAEDSETGSADFSETGNLSSDELGAVLGTEINLRHTGHLTQDQLQTWADACAMRNKMSKAVGRVKIKGNAAVKPGVTITLDGVGDRFNGDVYVTGVLHHFDRDWFTDVQFGWQEDWFYKKEDVMEKPAGGLLPGINGLQIGIVVDVDDTEEGGQYRVKVHVPTITSGNEGIWARVATLDAGAERGVYFRPEADDEVILGFLNDDPREPVILGCLHSKDTKKSPLPETEGNLEFGFVTKEKLKLIFDDTNKKLTISAPVGEQAKTFIIDGGGGSMEMKDENGNSIKMDSAGITIEAGAGKDVTINGGSGKDVVIKGTFVKIN
jgi:Rhs element Vgr protein